MEQYYVHSLKRLAIHALKTGDCDEYNRMQKENDDLFKNLFNRLKNGTIRIFYHEDATHRVAYFRSMKEPGKIMKGYWWKKTENIFRFQTASTKLLRTYYEMAPRWHRDGTEMGCYVKVLY